MVFFPNLVVKRFSDKPVPRESSASAIQSVIMPLNPLGSGNDTILSRILRILKHADLDASQSLRPFKSLHNFHHLARKSLGFRLSSSAAGYNDVTLFAVSGDGV